MITITKTKTRYDSVGCEEENFSFPEESLPAIRGDNIFLTTNCGYDFLYSLDSGDCFSLRPANYVSWSLKLKISVIISVISVIRGLKESM